MKEYPASIVLRREVKLDLIENKPYTRPEDVLSRALSSAAKHRMLIADAAPASSYDGLHSTNQAVAASPATGAGVRAAAAAGVEPMELGLINHDDEEFEEQEQALCALMGEETIAETNMWEDPECQMFNAIDQSGKQTSLCWQCHKPGHQKRDCWIRPRNQMIMNSRGGGNTRNNSSPYRTQF